MVLETHGQDTPRGVTRGALRVLVVDDDAEHRLLLEEVLRDADYAAVGIHSGHVAALRLGDAPDALADYALVVTDERMPDMAGTELAAWLRARRGPPVVLVSAFVDAALRARAAAAGVSKVLSKPFALDAFLDAVRATLRSTPFSPEEDSP